MKTADFKFLVECALKAPSGHNTQPWKFENMNNSIIIHPDFKRALPVVDAENYELYISLGCALENLLIASKHKGYKSKVQYPEKSVSSIIIELAKDDTNKVIPDISIRILDSKKNFENIIPLIIEASNLQFNNRDFVNELVNWIRFSKSEAEKKKDGIWSATMGMPGLWRFFGSMVMKNFVTAKSEEKRLIDLLEHTQGLAIFISDTNNAEAWVKTGQAFQRFGLTTTHLGVSHAHLNMPCEEIIVRQKLTKILGIGKKHSLLLIRYGYADRMPYSYRRSFDEVIQMTTA
jgi:hypothetical protein